MEVGDIGNGMALWDITRLLERGERAIVTIEEWYFSAFQVKERCDDQLEL